MDVLSIVMIIGVILVVAIIAFLLIGSKDKPEENEQASNEVSTVSAQRNAGARQNSDVFGGDDDMDTEKQAKMEELLTKYTAGNSDGIQEVEKLLEGDPNNVDLLDWLAFMYYSNGDIDKAINTYKRALANKPDNENQHYYLGNSYYKKNMFLEAKKCWSEVIRLKPSSKIAKNAQERINYLKSIGK